MKKRIFICYRRESSSDFVERLANRLQEKFVVCYDKTPKHRVSGELWQPLKEDINNSTHFVLVVDEKTFQFNDNKELDMVWREIDHALKKYEKDKRFKIIPLSVNGNEIPPKGFLIENGIANFDKYTFIKAECNDSDDFDSFYSDFILEKLGYDESKEKKKKMIKQSLFAIAAAALLLFGGTLLQQWNSARTPKLIFAGGGSVANMINEIVGDTVFIKKYKNSYYLDLPSENAWALLAEEVMINHTSDSEYNKFYPVCLSALEAPDSVFYKMVSKDDFMEKGTIISYRLKHDDTLKVYTNQNIGKDGIISIGDLSKKIKDWCQDKSVNIYLTQEKSGTYFIYQKLFKDSVDINSYKNQLNWYDGKLLKKNLENNNNQYIVLSSQYYTPKDIRGLNSIMVVDNSGVNIAKPMYLYFAGYTNSEQSDITIPEEMVNFMKHFGITIKSHMHQDALKVITPIDTLINWDTSFQNQGKEQNDKRKR